MPQLSKHIPLLAQADSALPSLNFAVELQNIAAQVGFDWPQIDGVIAKVKEELDEVVAETNIDNNMHKLEEEMGDLLFSCINLARHLKVNPDKAMQAANQKFYRRFTQLEEVAYSQQRHLTLLSEAELNQLWEQVKQQEKNN